MPGLPYGVVQPGIAGVVPGPEVAPLGRLQGVQLLFRILQLPVIIQEFFPLFQKFRVFIFVFLLLFLQLFFAVLQFFQAVFVFLLSRGVFLHLLVVFPEAHPVFGQAGVVFLHALVVNGLRFVEIRFPQVQLRLQVQVRLTLLIDLNGDQALFQKVVIHIAEQNIQAVFVHLADVLINNRLSVIQLLVVVVQLVPGPQQGCLAADQLGFRVRQLLLSRPEGFGGVFHGFLRFRQFFAAFLYALPALFQGGLSLRQLLIGVRQLCSGLLQL